MESLGLFFLDLIIKWKIWLRVKKNIYKALYIYS